MSTNSTAVAEFQRKSAQAQAALEKVRGRGTAGNGATSAMVDAGGRLRDLTFAPTAAKWGDRIPALVLKASRAAEQDAIAQVQKITKPLTDDPRLRQTLAETKSLLSAEEPGKRRPRPKAEESEDAYFRNFSPHDPR
ncbi:YbaB/EbfC family nucleoid-associated protein [Gordonia jinhuaensis]|uniref:YbaB/EbfC family nucleoid-associated protein n=1 Tax=Gordonia jinhuaensis TaxID=1517702 RepID=UPI001669F715|nr:YbaB/EbfC family nucleoid-associated protein [Gordonia jinhuaensis]